MQIITRNVTGIVHGDKDRDLDWQIGQMITTCENWSDRLDQAKANQTGNH